ncbi:hypothetical protein GCM10023096_03110 [Nonomuraea ferruginea]
MIPAFVVARTVAHDLVSRTQLSLARAAEAAGLLDPLGASVDVMAPNALSQ